jgi:hypothetical protein
MQLEQIRQAESNIEDRKQRIDKRESETLMV